MNYTHFNGSRLRIARIYNGISLTDLSRLADISKQSLSMYENGKNTPDYSRIQAFSRVLGFPVDYFFEDNKLNSSTETTYFRSQSTATKRDRAAQSIKLDFVAQMYKVLCEYVDFPMFNDPKVHYDGIDDVVAYDNQEAVLEIDEAAQLVRECWDVGEAPIDNLQYLLEQNGVLVTGVESDNKSIDAFSQRTTVNESDVFLIAVSLGDCISDCRIRFDMAHELGHIVLHPWSEDIEALSRDEFKTRERQANIFASSFLLPREMFLKDVMQYPTDLNYYRHMKKKWKVSIQAMIMRSRQLGAITDNQYQYMFRQLSKRGWRMNEPDDVLGSLNESIMQDAIDLLFDNNVLSPKSLLSIFKDNGISLYPSMIEELLHLRKGTMHINEIITPLVHIKTK